MTDGDIRTLAYTKSPKVSRRTTFQDELEAAVSARAGRTKTDEQSLDDFDEDEDDFLKELFKSRKKKINAFKSGRSKATINNFDLSDDEGENNRPKRVSFMKTQRSASPLQSTAATNSHEGERPDPSSGSSGRRKDSLTSQHSLGFSEERAESTVSEKSATDSRPPRSSRRPPTGSSEASWLDTPLPLPSSSGSGNLETPVPLVSESSEQIKDSVCGEGAKAPSPQPAGTGSMHTGVSSTDGAGEREPPRPKPRQRTFGLSSRVVEEPAGEPASPVSRAATSSVSIALSTDKASSTTTTADTSSGPITGRSLSPHGLEGDQTDSSGFRSSSSPRRSQQSHSLSRSTADSETRDKRSSEDSKGHDEQYSTSFEEFHEDSEDRPDHSVSRLSDIREKSPETTRPSSSSAKSSLRSRSTRSSTVESKYMGTLTLLDRKLAPEEAPPEAADSLRAAVYQDWLKKKKEKLQESSRLKKQEDNLKEEKRKQGERTKMEDAKASYEAWRQKKAESLRARAKEKHDSITKEQRVVEEQAEKRESARKVFEKWKQEHDQQLKERYRKQKRTENKLKEKKQETEEERQRSSKSAFSSWDGKKKNVLSEKVIKERKEIENKAEEERYMREERDKMALDMYETWLTKKEREQRRQREERKIQAILQDDPPPPWSPPSKTVPFGK